MIRINLLPVKQLQAEVTRRRELLSGAVALGLVTVLLAGAYWYRSSQLKHLEGELANLRAEIQALNAKVKEVGELQVKIKDLRGKQRVIDDLKKKQTGPVLVLASLSHAAPNALWLTDLRETNGSVSMNGLAVDNETVANFMRALTLSKHFGNVDLVEITHATGQATPLKKFAIRAGVIYRAADKPPADLSGQKALPKQEKRK